MSLRKVRAQRRGVYPTQGNAHSTGAAAADKDQSVATTKRGACLAIDDPP